MTIGWSYALNAWKQTYDMFARKEHHVRALKTVSVSGFRAVEIACGAGRWEPMGNLEMILANHASIDGFRDFLASCGVDAVSSYFLDPGVFLSRTSGMPLVAANAADRAEIVDLAAEYLEILPQLAGDRLVVKPAPPYWRSPDVSDDTLTAVADCWNAVGEAGAAHGVKVAMHLDCLSAIRATETIGRLLDLTDPAHVGLAIDTAELTIAGLDPLEIYRRWPARVLHLQFKDVRLRDDLGEALLPNAEMRFLSAGGSRHVDRWFFEMGVEGGLVDFPAMIAALRSGGYQGWIVVECDQSPYPATSAMLNGWYRKHRLDETG
jgi:inosose dehydratase